MIKILGRSLLAWDNTQLWPYSDEQPLTAEVLLAKFSVLSSPLPDCLALVDDSIDDIPSVSGVGAKTAVQLLHFFASWQDIKRNIESVNSLPKKLVEYQKHVDISLRLTQAYTRALRGKPARLKRNSVNKEKLIAYVEPLGFLRNTHKLIDML